MVNHFTKLELTKRGFAIAGGDGVGKSTLAIELGNKIGAKFTNIAFADYVRESLLQFGAFSRELLYEKPTKPCIRNLLKGWGGYCKLEYGQDYWINKLAEDIGTESATIGDLRFEAEAKWVTENGFFLILLGPADSYELNAVSKYAHMHLRPFQPNLADLILKHICGGE